jgi:anti-sigma B factor antagonist
VELSKKVLQDGIIVLQLAGDMHMGADCQRLTQAAQQVIQEPEKRVILDLSPLELIDSAGVGAVVSCFSLVRKSGGTLRVAGSKGMVDTVLKLTQIHRAIGFFPTVAEAAADFPSPSESAKPNS